MTPKPHISETSSARFEVAISASLARLESGGQVFNVSDVIRNAQYEDGSAVGVTTLYAKGANGKRIHANLLAKIKVACARSRAVKAAKKSTSPRAEADGVMDGSGLWRQLIEQECRLQEIEAALAAVSHKMRHAQEEQYVAVAALNQLTKGALLDLVRPLRELEAALGDSDLVGKLKDEAVTLANQCRRLARPG